MTQLISGVAAAGPQIAAALAGTRALAGKETGANSAGSGRSSDARGSRAPSTGSRILIDGPSGSGKTTLAAAIAAALADQGQGGPAPRVLNVEEWTPGWDGLAEADLTTRRLLAGETESYRRWDWVAGEWAETVPVDPDSDWIIEGCGTLTADNAGTATVCVWVQTDAATAKERAIAREGAHYPPFWQRWNRQEQSHWEQHQPWALADFVVET